MNLQPIYYTEPRGEMARFLPALANASVLEIGCGAGLFAKWVGFATEYWGIEPFTPAASRAQACLSRVLVGTYDECEQQIPDARFDLVICNDVIEHMPDHLRFLTSIRRKLVPGGYLVGSVPNVRHYSVLYRLVVERDWPYAEEGILDRTHLRFFTQRSLRRSLTSCQFAIDEIAAINSPFERPLHGAKDRVQKYMLRAANVISFRLLDDIEYVQIAFRARTSSQQ